VRIQRRFGLNGCLRSWRRDRVNLVVRAVRRFEAASGGSAILVEQSDDFQVEFFYRRLSN